jgi:CHAD domain-containing protein
MTAYVAPIEAIGPSLGRSFRRDQAREEAMSEQDVLEPEPVVAATDGKWIGGISPDQPVCEMAGQVLNARLKAVHHFLPLAAEKSEEDEEYIHQLRIAVRRADEAVRIFARLMEESGALRDRLRQIRRAADEARNWDVMVERFSHGGDIPTTILEQVRARRREVQGPVAAVYREVTADACEAKLDSIVREVEAHRHGEGKRQFGRQAPKYLAPVVKKFFRAAESDLTTDESLHALRIRTKKLRYTMEIVAAAFNAAFRQKLYRQVTLFQDLLGTVNDHATASMLFRDWRSKAENAEQRAFLEGLLLAEERAVADLRVAFLATWTPKVVSDLKRDFRAYG